jgi:hypothetical protein
MAQRGGPWRLAGYAIPEVRVARRVEAWRGVETHEGERGLRWIVSAYVLGVIGGGLVALVGLGRVGTRTPSTACAVRIPASRSPNRTCEFPHIRLSIGMVRLVDTVHARCRGRPCGSPHRG